MGTRKTIYKIIFLNHGKVYELFARSTASSEMYGFVQVSELIFEDESKLVVDPTEEKMREEFAGVTTLHLPMHSVIRIEEVEKRGACQIRDSESGEKITPFPVPPARSRKD